MANSARNVQALAVVARNREGPTEQFELELELFRRSSVGGFETIESVTTVGVAEFIHRAGGIPSWILQRAGALQPVGACTVRCRRRAGSQSVQRAP
ncbi:hypothetical protein EP51_40220 (plasmid) [Rhodococcus opacus]|uniref:Uncharacterized protein n=1 Tax=Rhodococcus opacus TaxID=37919 RepID=A0A076EWY1_RHOOP|nr:hypothetical protein EP51_40220 [Rhodococcus opacus]